MRWAIGKIDFRLARPPSSAVVALPAGEAFIATIYGPNQEVWAAKRSYDDREDHSYLDGATGLQFVDNERCKRAGVKCFAGCHRREASGCAAAGLAR